MAWVYSGTGVKLYEGGHRPWHLVGAAYGTSTCTFMPYPGVSPELWMYGLTSASLTAAVDAAKAPNMATEANVAEPAGAALPSALGTPRATRCQAATRSGFVRTSAPPP